MTSPFLWRQTPSQIMKAPPLKGSVLHGKGRTPKKPIDQLTPDGILIRTFPSIRAASNEMGIPDSSITRVAQGLRKTSGGFQWRYVTQEDQILRARHGGAYSKAAHA